MTNIADLKPALADKWVQQQMGRLDPLSLFTIDYTDVSRQQGEAANGDSSDGVYFGYKAEPQMRKLCEAFGFERLPETWGEFKGLLDYCHMLHGLLLGPRTVPLDEAVRRHGLNAVQKYYPKDYEAVEAFFDNNFNRLRAIHRAEGTLARLGKEYREFDDSE